MSQLKELFKELEALADQYKNIVLLRESLSNEDAAVLFRELLEKVRARLPEFDELFSIIVKIFEKLDKLYTSYVTIRMTRILVDPLIKKFVLLDEHGNYATEETVQTYRFYLFLSPSIDAVYGNTISYSARRELAGLINLLYLLPRLEELTRARDPMIWLTFPELEKLREAFNHIGQRYEKPRSSRVTAAMK